MMKMTKNNKIQLIIIYYYFQCTCYEYYCVKIFMCLARTYGYYGIINIM